MPSAVTATSAARTARTVPALATEADAGAEGQSAELLEPGLAREVDGYLCPRLLNAVWR